MSVYLEIRKNQEGFWKENETWDWDSSESDKKEYLNWSYDIFCSSSDCVTAQSLRDIITMESSHTWRHTNTEAEVWKWSVLCQSFFFKASQISLRHWTRSNCGKQQRHCPALRGCCLFHNPTNQFPAPRRPSSLLWSPLVHCNSDCKIGVVRCNILHIKRKWKM